MNVYERVDFRDRFARLIRENCIIENRSKNAIGHEVAVLLVPYGQECPESVCGFRVMYSHDLSGYSIAFGNNEDALKWSAFAKAVRDFL
jgi:hypothetical protein